MARRCLPLIALALAFLLSPPIATAQGIDSDAGIDPGVQREKAERLKKMRDNFQKKRQQNNHFPMLHQLSDERFQKVLDLATSPESKLDEALASHPDFSQLPEPSQGQMKQRLLHFRERIRKDALTAAEKLQISLTPENQDAFIRSFWEKKIRIEKEIKQQMQPLKQKLMDEARDELLREFKN